MGFVPSTEKVLPSASVLAGIERSAAVEPLGVIEAALAKKASMARESAASLTRRSAAKL